MRDVQSSRFKARVQSSSEDPDRHLSYADQQCLLCECVLTHGEEEAEAAEDVAA